MESNSWSNRLSTASSRRYHHHQSRSDLFIGGGYDETDGDDELGALFLCPFCAEDFDIVGLCCHVDEDHPLEAKNGVCPVCAKRVGMDIRKRRLRRGGPNSTFSLLRKELRDGNLQSLLGGSCFVSSSNTEPDPLLSSFIFNSPKVDERLCAQPLSIIEPTSVKESTSENFHERNAQQSQLSDKDQEEKARKGEFVQEIVMSTILDDYL
ncbi:Protein DEHYDRATION-INDUCED 19 like [Melia azedarach]|uniref:Protein DEHYDRATION-INDUCED 19 like n=1 Tax=Melia azedarach TaxID=155640 RepID=A0ACC1YE17_MELAZ|nr:Protein DEHYDRATION-INDUCED 19 like [Melia azedarach]